MKEPSKPADRLSRLLAEPRVNLRSGSRVVYSLLLGGSLTIIVGIPAVLIARGYTSALPSNVLSTSQLLALESRPVESGRLLPPLPSPNSSSSTANNQSFLVYVNGDSPYLLAQVRQVEPGAFVRSHQGRRVIQTGSFTNQEYAQEQIIALRSRGLTAQLALSQQTSQPSLAGQKLLRAGNTLNTRYSGPRQIVHSGETRSLALTLVNPVSNQAGQIVLPAGSLIQGQVMPAPDGSRFLANSIQVDGTVYPLNARSATLANLKASQHSIGAIATNTARAAGGVVLNQVLQGHSVQEVLSSSRAAIETSLPKSTAVGQTTASQTTVIEPNAVIPLQLTSDF